MKQKITYKQRLLYALIGGVLFSFVIYNMALADTVELVQKNSELRDQIIRNQDAPEEVKAARRKIKKIEQLVGTNKDYEKIDIHQLLLEAVTGYVQENSLVLNDFPKPYKIVSDGYITKTAQLTVEGDFISLLKLVYFLESDYSVGKVVAINFRTSKELRTRKRKLNTTIYLQNVKAENHEENS